MLLVASYIFYGSWNWKFLFLILISTILDYICGLKIYQETDQKRKKLYLLLSIAGNLTILGFFKYFNFFVHDLQLLLHQFGFSTHPVVLHIILPVGISFYTFQTMSYTIDVYRGELVPTRRFFDLALFVAFFPQLVAGPIERAKHLLPQILHPRLITREKVTQGLWLIYWGFFLKIFVADNLARIVDRVFLDTGSFNGAEVLLGLYAFAFQILGDFAGYSSIAIGLARLMGIDIMTNFLFPYFVTNPRKFWMNWHISLSTWLRDYLYIPLGGNRRGNLITYRNLFITMLLGGLWHGAAWTFVFWGIYQALILIIYRLVSPVFPRFHWDGILLRIWIFIKIIFFFHVICAGWLIFRAQSLEQMYKMAGSVLVNFSPATPTSYYYVCQIIFYTWLLLAVQIFQKRGKDVLSIQAIPVFLRLPLLLIIYYALMMWGEFGANEFIYFQF